MKAVLLFLAQLFAALVASANVGDTGVAGNAGDAGVAGEAVAKGTVLPTAGNAALQLVYEASELPKFNGEVAPRIKRERGLSRRAAEQGWEFFYAGDDRAAMRRFNQAWMLDSRNPNALWGMSAALMSRTRNDAAAGRADSAVAGRAIGQAVDLMRQAQVFAPNNGRLLGDLGFALSAQGRFLNSEGRDGSALFAEAEKYFTQALALEPDYPPTLANYAIFKYNTGDLPAALEYATKAEALGYVFEDSFKKLRQLHPE